MDRGDNNNPRSPEWVIQIKKRLRERVASDAKRRRTIGRVSSKWRKVQNHAFDPEMIRIGPLRSSDDPCDMDEHKMRYLIRLVGGKLERRRSEGDVSSTTEGERVSVDRERVEDVLLDDLVEAMRKLEQETRACYSMNFQPKRPSAFTRSDDFVEMMVVDGCFVVELLRLNYDRHTKSTVAPIVDDPIFTDPRILTTVRRDLLLLENQLPFFVLKKLYELINNKNNSDRVVPLEELAVTFFESLLPRDKATPKLDGSKAHLLEVFHSIFLKLGSEKVHKNKKNRVKSQSNPNGGIRTLHFASELEEAGVKFKKRKGHNLLDIEFGRGTLRVPPLSMNDHTISLLLNLVAYELSDDHLKPIYTNYLMFWNSLVNSSGDIQILHKHGIINNALGSNDDVANLLIRCREVMYNRDLGYLYDEIKEVNEYCERYYETKYRVWWRSLIRERFSSPWTCLSLFAAIILLLLTLLQTLYTMYTYYRQH